MTMFASKRSSRAVLGAGLLAAGLLASPLESYHAHAMSACRSDPIVVLSNGVVLDLSATIGIDVSNIDEIAQISYTLHAPAGTTVAKVVSTDGDVNYKEQFTLDTDSPSGVYGVDTLVTTLPITGGATPPAVTAAIEGGYASALGVSPAVVGLKAWTTTSAATATSPQGKAGHAQKGAPAGQDSQAASASQGSQLVTTLPDKMNDFLNNWAANAAWSATASSDGQAGQTVTASVNL